MSVSVVLYFIGSVLYIPASVLLFWPLLKIPSTVIFIVASVAFLVAGCIDLAKTQTLINVFYLVGGLLFTIGSFLFLSYDDVVLRVGVWIFRFGSLHYIIGSSLLVRVHLLQNTSHKVAATLQYMCGSTLFIIGGILSETRQSVVAFATVWTIGSVAFTGGASFNLCNEIIGAAERPVSHLDPEYIRPV